MRKRRVSLVTGTAARPDLELDCGDVEAIRRARASIRAGRKVPMDVVFGQLLEST